ncbi:MAG: ROK family protein, partial [Gloeomargarita sp. DG_1_4_bins_134]
GLLQFTHKSITTAAEITAQEVGEAARLGNPIAQDLIRRAGRMLGVALTSLLHTLNPERVIVGGSVLALGDDYWQPLVRTIQERAMQPVPVVRSPLRAAGLLGAAALVWQK